MSHADIPPDRERESEVWDRPRWGRPLVYLLVTSVLVLSAPVLVMVFFDRPGSNETKIVKIDDKEKITEGDNGTAGTKHEGDNGERSRSGGFKLQTPAEAREAELRRLAEVKRVRIKNILEPAQDKIDRLEVGIQKLSDKLDELKTMESEEGRRLALKEEKLLLFESLVTRLESLDQPVPRLRIEFSQLLGVPPNEDEDFLKRAAQWQETDSQKALDHWERRVDPLLSSLNIIETDVSILLAGEDEGPMADQSLGESLAAFNARKKKVELEQRLRAIAQGREAARKELSEALAELEAAEARAEAARTRKSAKFVDQAVKFAVQDFDRMLEYQKRRVVAMQPEILNLLLPLSTKDTVQPRQILGGTAQGEKVAEPQPISLTRLKSLKVLDQTEGGMEKLAMLNNYRWTKRPRWNFLYDVNDAPGWTEQQTKLVTDMQKYLIKYGDIYVKEGILAP